MEAEDFLQMRSIVQGHSRELDDPGELDIFINNMKYNTFVQRVTRDERRQRAMLHKYEGDKLLETLNSVLMMPDCPGRNEAISTSRAIRQVSTPPREATTGAQTSQIVFLYCILTGPPVLSHGTCNQYSCSTESPSMGRDTASQRMIYGAWQLAN